MSYDNGGLRDYDIQCLRDKRMYDLEDLVEEQDKEIEQLKSQIKVLKETIVSLNKTDYVKKYENAKHDNNVLKKEIDRLRKLLEDQSTIEGQEKEILRIILSKAEIYNYNELGLLYRIDVNLLERFIISKEVKDYLVSKGVKDMTGPKVVK